MSVATAEFSETFGQQVADLCYAHYRQRLSKRGKPQPRCEWTLLAAVVVRYHGTAGEDRMQVVAMGTGSKCLGRSQMCENGYVINDSHAEVIARRAFLRYLYGQIRGVYCSDKPSSDSIFVFGDDNRCSLRPGITFHLFTSHVPCGDAAIFPKVSSNGSAETSLIEDDVVGKSVEHTESRLLITEHRKRTSEVVSDSTAVPKRTKHDCFISASESHTNSPTENCVVNRDPLIPDINRTGAKCIPGEPNQDPLRPGAEYHVVGVLRMKPGRGEQTLSMSCSDKMARWNAVGLQGALISHFLSTPIYLKSIVIGGKLFNEAALRRAVLSRRGDSAGFSEHFSPPDVHLIHAASEFEHSRLSVEAEVKDCGQKIVPSAAAIIWYTESGRDVQEVSAGGRKLGVTNKNRYLPQARCSICKAELFQTFLKLIADIPESRLPASLRERLSAIPTYEDYKKAAIDYQQVWTKLKTQSFTGWQTTPRHYNMFTPDSCRAGKNNQTQ